MKEEKQRKRLAMSALIISVVCITIVFLMTSTTLIKVEETGKLDSVKWDVHFENLKEYKTGDAKVLSSPEISKKGTYIGDYEISLSKPGDSITYTFDVVNSGDFNAQLINIVKTRLKCKSMKNSKEDEEIACDSLNYTLKYKNGNLVKEEDILNKRQRANLVLTLKYDSNKLPISKIKVHGLSIILLYNQV